jgi:hypothetical protein
MSTPFNQQNNGYVRLSRAALSHPLFQRNRTALFVYMQIAVLINWRTGELITNRTELGLLLQMNQNTLASTLRTLANHQLITSKSTNKQTTISICNMEPESTEIQQSSPDFSPANHQQVTNPTGVSNKKKNNTNTADKPQKVAEPKELTVKDRIGIVYYQAVRALDLPVRNHNHVKLRISELAKHPEPDKIIEYLEMVRDEYEALALEFKPALNEALDIYTKRIQINAAIKRSREAKKEVFF